MKLNKLFKQREGFTLIELVLVIVILGILLVILIPNITNARQKARELAFDMAVKRLNEAATMFTMDFPNTKATWASHDGGEPAIKNKEITEDNTFEAWFLYLDEYPKDPTRKGGTFTVEIYENGDIEIQPDKPASRKE